MVEHDESGSDGLVLTATLAVVTATLVVVKATLDRTEVSEVFIFQPSHISTYSSSKLPDFLAGLNQVQVARISRRNENKDHFLFLCPLFGMPWVVEPLLSY